MLYHPASKFRFIITRIFSNRIIHSTAFQQFICFFLFPFFLSLFFSAKTVSNIVHCLKMHYLWTLLHRGGSWNHGVLYYRPLHRDNWGLILVLIEINRAYIILFSTNCHHFTVKWHRFIIKICLVYMIQPSIFFK